MDIFSGADKAIREMNRQNLKAFNSLKLAKWDELNVIGKVNGVYDDSTRRAERKYYEVAVEAYIVAMYEAKVDRNKAHRMADKAIDLIWVMEWLEDVDPVTEYSFYAEKERKKARLLEALSVSQQRNKEIDKALRYWTVQVGQYADNAVIRARHRAFVDAGVERVMWVTQKDERVCKGCDDLDGKIFPIDNIPPLPQHYHCRCYVRPVLD